MACRRAQSFEREFQNSMPRSTQDKNARTIAGFLLVWRPQPCREPRCDGEGRVATDERDGARRVVTTKTQLLLWRPQRCFSFRKTASRGRGNPECRLPTQDRMIICDDSEFDIVTV